MYVANDRVGTQKVVLFPCHEQIYGNRTQSQQKNPIIFRSQILKTHRQKWLTLK